MKKLYFNTRDELTSVDPDMVAVVQANGNYSHVHYINKKHFMLTTPIGKMEETLRSCNVPGGNQFVRLGRSIIVNHRFLHKISLVTQVLTLSDGEHEDLRVKLPKALLKSYKSSTLQAARQAMARNATQPLSNHSTPQL